MRLKKYAEHTLDADRLHGVVIDAGCRDYDFSRAVIADGWSVIALDIDDAVIESKPALDSFVAMRRALTGEGYPAMVGIVHAGNGSRIVDGDEVLTCRIGDFHINAWPLMGAVKLDIEGSEYDVLLTWPGPIAEQITVEYHEHTGQGKAKHGDDVYERIAKHLGQWYTLVQDDPMDTLWVLK